MEYPWYEVLENSDEITQGDILKDCPVPVLLNTGKCDLNTAIEAKIEYVDGIILTQACDIANNKVENVIICGITSKSDFEAIYVNQGNSIKNTNNVITGIIKGQQNAYHIINNYKSEDFSQDYYIINFKDIFSVPVVLAKEIANQNGKRLRLCPPYREHLSQAFARYFMRVGLPINIKIETEKV